MTRNIKFTSFGVPYVLEFENVSFVPEPRRHVPPSSESPPSPSSSTSSFCHIDSPPPPQRRPSFSLRSPSSLFKRKPASARHISPASGSRRDRSTDRTSNNLEGAHSSPPPPQFDVSETNGIYIQFPQACNHPQMSRKEGLVHLQQTISVAVLNAGMSRSPGNTTHPEKHSNRSAVHGNRGYRTPDALFCGTYGQMMAALEGAGLSATPCAEEDLSGYTRLGALFVARNDGASGVQLRKITLWG